MLSDDIERRRLVDAITSDIGTALVDELRIKLITMDKYVFGRLADSLEWNPALSLVGSKLRYAWSVEYGRKAGGSTPLEPLKEWAKKRFGVDDNAAMGIAIAVEKKIRTEGIDQTRFMKLGLLEFIEKRN